jgi:hypothetical protein
VKQRIDQVYDASSNDRAAEIEAAWALHEGRFKILTPEALARLSEAQNWRCCYCGCRMEFGSPRLRPTFEHVIPKACGGRDTLENLVAACISCNVARGSDYWPVHIEVLALIQGVAVQDVRIPPRLRPAPPSTYSIMIASPAARQD